MHVAPKTVTEFSLQVDESFKSPTVKKGLVRIISEIISPAILFNLFDFIFSNRLPIRIKLAYFFKLERLIEHSNLVID